MYMSLNYKLLYRLHTSYATEVDFRAFHYKTTKHSTLVTSYLCLKIKTLTPLMPLKMTSERSNQTKGESDRPFITKQQNIQHF